MAEPKNKMLRLSESSVSEPSNIMLRLAGHFVPEDVTKNVVVPFLDEKSLYALTWVCKHYRNQYKDKHTDKKAAAEMLHCVLNPTLANQARFLELLSVPKQDLNGPPLYLIQNHGEEVYFNKARVKKIKTMRWSTNVLEAILRTGNFHLAKSLFNCIPKEAKTDALKQQIRDIKAQGIWGMPELQTAYKNLIVPWKELYEDKNWKELDRLSGLLGQAQKEHLPWFSLYLFCHHVSHANANYKLAPNWICILWGNTELDLDLFGSTSIYALYKMAMGAPEWSTLRSWRLFGFYINDDSAAFNRQCEVLSSEMDKVIKQFGLEVLESDVNISPKFSARL